METEHRITETEFILDTKSQCFLCLQKIAPNPPGTPQRSEICLRNICRFLQIDTLQVLLKGLEEGLEDVTKLQQGMKYNFLVNLCTSCYSVTEKLSSLIQDLEEVKLKVNEQSRLLHHILEEAEEPEEGSMPGRENDECSKTAEDLVVEYLRRETKQKCAAHNNSVVGSSPMNLEIQTMLPPFAQDETSQSTNDEASHLPPTPHFPGMSTSRLVEPLQIQMDLRTPSATAAIPLPSPESPPNFEEVGTIPESGMIQPNNFGSDNTVVEMERCILYIMKNNCRQHYHRDYYKCGFCSGKVRKKAMRKHLMFSHTEKLLAFAKSGSVSEDTFKTLFYQALGSEMDRCEMYSVTKANGDEGTRYRCYICRRSAERRRFKDHLVSYHSDVLAGKLKGLQADNCKRFLDNILGTGSNSSGGVLACDLPPRDLQLESRDMSPHLPSGEETCTKKRKMNSDEEVPVVPGNGANLKPGNDGMPPTSVVCPHCRESCSSSSFRVHLLYFHPDRMFLSVKPPHRSLSQFSASCRQIFEGETKGYQDIFRKDATVTPRQCAYCVANYMYKDTYLCHLVNSHQQILAAKIKELEEQQ